MKKLILNTSTLASVVVFGLTASAQLVGPTAPRATATKTGFDPKLNIIDSSFSLRGRNQHDNDGVRTRNQLQYNLDLKLILALTADGKWKIVTRAKTGSTFESGWNDLGIGNNTQFADDLALRQLYVQYSNGNTEASLGFLPVLPNGDVKGVLNYDDDGWLDGVRVSQSKISKWANKVTVSVGRIDSFNKPSLFSRGIDSPNVMQIHVQGNINKRIAYVTETTQINPEGAESEQFLRMIVDIATADLVSFVDKVVLEQLIQNSEKPLQGFAVGARSALGDGWSLTTQYSYKGKQLAQNEKFYGPRDDFYRQGHQASLILTKKFESRPIELSFAVGKTLSGNEAFSKSGLRAETRLKIKFGKTK